MPELPEVEVTRLGIRPHIQGRRVDEVRVRNSALRWPVPASLGADLIGGFVETVERRGKFILIGVADRVYGTQGSGTVPQESAPRGTLLVHLGMTGTLQIVRAGVAAKLHDHVDVLLGDVLLRYNDPRRFGAVLWHAAKEGAIASNRHLQALGVEPLSRAFEEEGGLLLFKRTRGRSAAVKQVLLAGAVVVGVGNIYASESLFRAGIDPATPAGRIGLVRYRRLATAIRETLAEAIRKGGSTLRDFVGSDGAPGYFQLDYFVYGRAGAPCRVCGTLIRAIRQGQRSTFYCPRCQR